MQFTLIAALVALVGCLTDAGDTDSCQKCKYVTGGGVVCGTTATGERREFSSLCEMNRINCVDTRQVWSASNSGACVEPNAKLWSTQSRAQSPCASCAGSGGSPVCGRNAQGRLLTFVNACWMERNNCLNPGLAYTYVSNGYCQASPALVSSTLVSGDGMAAHPNAKLINSPDCGKLPIGSKVMNGVNAGLYQFPWVVLLNIVEPARSESYTCGGSIISARYVLTAAHCVSGYQTPIRLNVLIGEYTLSTSPDCGPVAGRQTCAPPSQVLDVDRVIVHPQYNNNTLYGNDLALLRLRQSMFFATDSVKPICLPLGIREESRTFSGEPMTVIGWGTTASGRPADTLQAATVPAVGNAACQQSYGNSARILASQICAGGNARDSCAGDSGGPLMYPMLAANKFAEYGLVSYGVTCGDSNPPPGVYTRVGAHMAWLLDSMQA